jgi:DNA uptake protein ComE-like DNA-binding protein
MNRMLKQMMVLGTVTLAALSACAKEETPSVSDTAHPDSSGGSVTTVPEGVPVSTPTPSATGTSGMVNPATASQADIVAAGVADSLAGAIVAARPASMVAVDKMLAKTYNEAKRDSIYARLWMPIDPNKATREEIMLIPGVGAKMAHEFEEYRPWTSVEQFRREIGKYVDKAEVARLEQYITIK